MSLLAPAAPSDFTLIGHAQQRGDAWLPRQRVIGGQSNFYPGAIPVADVERRLFGWKGERRRIAVERPAQWNEEPSHVGVDGVPSVWDAIDSRVAITRDDSGDNTVFGVVSQKYEIHQYRDWLLRDVANLLDDSLSISSAGYLRHGALAWVEISVPANVRVARGVTFRPNLLATSSMDGTSATIFKRTVTDVVCDNTRRVALKEDGEELRVRHTKGSGFRIASAREALDLVYEARDVFAAQIEELLATPVSDAQWGEFLKVLVPEGTRTGKPDSEHRAMEKARQRAELDRLYRTDSRCGQWHGTAHGALQAVNTYEHHVLAPRQRERGARNAEWTVDGEFDRRDKRHYADLVRLLEG
ncbi:DUF945 domain-containing protein [Isoptericola sp. 4D.3]|uniref:DUF945 domain-containing protein n=1 Tax=Isoptericola peretonis TaxID=2918523 RepID=A0ABT0J8X7_9MICO|nr:DUF945 domain-containing protein [Isoptericola sp. 4D.3]